MKSKLDTIANLAIIVTATAATVLMVSRFLSDGQQQAQSQIPNRVYAVGDQLSARIAVDFSKGNQTLLVVLHSKCRFCTASLPFYRQLVAGRDRGRRDTQVVAVGIEPEEVLDQYLKTHGVAFDDIIPAPIQAFKVSGTPALILADHAGVVKKSWHGQLSEVQQKEVFQHILGS